MHYSLKRVSTSDGTWQALLDSWEQQCQEVTGDCLENYAIDSLPVLQEIAEITEQPSKQRITWAVALYDQTRPLVAAMANLAPLPNYDRPVLRIRQLTVCPFLDFGALSEDTYAETLIELTSGIVSLSQNQLAAGHIHVHLRSPADVAYFQAFGKTIDGENVFDSVTHKGAWLRIDKKATA
jgi:hypothetical protein